MNLIRAELQEKINVAWLKIKRECDLNDGDRQLFEIAYLAGYGDGSTDAFETGKSTLNIALEKLKDK